MKTIDKIKCKSINEFVDWIDENFAFDTAPYMFWFDNEFCKKCQAEEIHDVDRCIKTECAWCEITGKCKFFQDMNEVPNTKQIIKLWLESEDNNGV